MRTPRNSNFSPESLLIPFDVMKFGSEEDPCFGKLFDLSTPECQNCGDQEQCSILFFSKVKKQRLLFEKNNPVKDLEIDKLEFKEEIKSYIARKLKQGFKKSKIPNLVYKKFKIKIKIEDYGF